MGRKHTLVVYMYVMSEMPEARCEKWSEFRTKDGRMRSSRRRIRRLVVLDRVELVFRSTDNKLVTTTVTNECRRVGLSLS